MKNKKLFVMMSVILAMGLAACGGNKSSKEPEPSSSEPAPSSQVTPSSTSQPGPSSSQPGPSSSQPGPSSSQPGPSSSQPGPSSSTSQPSSTSEVPPEPVKSLNITESKFVNEGGKVYFQVTGTQENHTADEFKWAWGIRERNADFAYGKEAPEAADFAAAEFDNNKQFVLKLCLTDIEGLKTGSFYRIYGGTPATYGDIAFTDTQADARDTSRHYYLRADQDNSFVYDNVQPLSFTLATMVEVAEADLPAGVTNAGAYLKFGGVNEAGITEAMLDEWHTAGKIAGDFQRVIGGYSRHNHVDAERFWKVEDDKVFFYVYTGFMANDEGWMMHFDMVGGNSGANLQFDNVLWGETEYVISGSSWRIYADSTKSAESDFYGCLGVKREKWVDPSIHVHSYGETSDEIYPATADYIKTEAFNCKGCDESVLRWSALDFDTTLSDSGLEKNTDNIRFKSGSVENKGGEASTGSHAVYKINMKAAAPKAGLAFRIQNTSGASGTAPVFKTISGDSSLGAIDNGDGTYTTATHRYGLKVNGVEYLLGDDDYGNQSNKSGWFDWPVEIALNAGVNTIDVFAYAGYRARMYEFQITGLPHVTPAHVHQAAADWSSDENSHWHACTAAGCPVENFKLDEAAHTFGDPYDVVDATCSAKGSYKVKCSVCNYVKTVETDKTDHTWVEGTPANNTDGFAVTPLSCSCGKVGAKMAVDSFTGNTKTNSTYKHDNNTTVTYKIVVSKAGNYELKIGAFVANNRTKDLSAAPYTVKVGTGDDAVAVPVSSGTYEALGIGTNSAKLFVLCPTIALAEGENVIAITQGGGGYRLTFGGDVVVAEL